MDDLQISNQLAFGNAIGISTGIFPGVECTSLPPFHVKDAFNTSDSEPETRLLKWIITAGQAPNIVETSGFQDIRGVMKSAGKPDAGVIEQRICSLAMHNINKQKELLKLVPGEVALSVDFWNPQKGNHSTCFVGVAFHYITIHGQLAEQLLNFCEVKADVISMAEAILQTLELYGLESKTIYFMLDNGGKNDLVLKELQRRYIARGRGGPTVYVRLRCVRHAIYQAAREFAQAINSSHSERNPPTGGITAAINKLRRIIEHIVSQPAHAWNEAVEFEAKSPQVIEGKPPTRKLCLDKNRQWFTTLAMMESALYYRSVLEFYVAFRPALKSFQINTADWSFIAFATNHLAQFVSALKQAGALLRSREADYSPTLFKYLRTKRSLEAHIQEGIATAPHSSLSTALQTSYGLLRRYYSTSSSSPVYVWSSIFDPCVKVHGLLADATQREELEHVVRAWGELEQKISQVYYPQSIMKVFEARQELYRYVGLPLESLQCDAIRWWQVHSPSFPLLSPFVYKVLSIPGAAVVGDRMLPLHRDTALFRRANQRLGAQTTLTALAVLKQIVHN
ncbi:hypothetical protein PM082_012389 [Marasmius tenuissimus]|nr:hypothetical protein PM082_012389 [Marasmius tenuissimus]